MIKEISYTLDYDYDHDNGFSWVARPSDDLTMMDGSYEFTVIDDDDHRGALRPSSVNRPSPFPASSVARPRSRSSSALRGLKKRAEAAPDAGHPRHRERWRRQDHGLGGDRACVRPIWAIARW